MRIHILGLLSLILALTWISVLGFNQDLQIIACDVGQGDAILIQKNSDQILIDSGYDDKVLDCLGKYMPFWDRNLELFVLTHPDRDHSGGLPEVLDRYNIDLLLTNDLSKPEFSSQTVEVIKSKVGGSDIEVVHPTRGLTMRLGMIYLDVLHPTVEFVDSKTNNYSIVILLKYNQFKALFTGDIEDIVSDELSFNSSVRAVDYLKVPHHGSKNGLSEKLLEVARPKIGVISVGAKNPYGHPHKEVLDLLQKYNVTILRTDEMGILRLRTNSTAS